MEPSEMASSIEETRKEIDKCEVRFRLASQAIRGMKKCAQNLQKAMEEIRSEIIEYGE